MCFNITKLKTLLLVKSKRHPDSMRQLCELISVTAVSVYTVLDKQRRQCAGLTIPGLDMTISVMVENNC